MKLKLLLLPGAKTPKITTSGAAGIDLSATKIESVPGIKKQFIIYTGVCIEIPKGFVGLLFPRSSVAKTDLRMSNSVGVIDSDYRGEITAYFDAELSSCAYAVGDKCVQLVIVPIPCLEFEFVDRLSTTKRACGGYGSTGK